jgi:hypothetical protein
MDGVEEGWRVRLWACCRRGGWTGPGPRDLDRWSFAALREVVKALELVERRVLEKLDPPAASLEEALRRAARVRYVDAGVVVGVLDDEQRPAGGEQRVAALAAAVATLGGDGHVGDHVGGEAEQRRRAIAAMLRSAGPAGLELKVLGAALGYSLASYHTRLRRDLLALASSGVAIRQSGLGVRGARVWIESPAPTPAPAPTSTPVPTPAAALEEVAAA